MTTTNKRFYVYELRDPDGVVFYVGKGKGQRWKAHKYEAEKGKTCRKLYNKIRKLWKTGRDFQSVKVFESHDETEAFNEERRLIALYGRENLCNLTDGGEGASGAIRSKEARAALSLRRKGVKASEETRQRMREGNKNRKRPSRETIEKRAMCLRGVKWTDERKAKLSKTRQGWLHTEETKLKLKAASSLRVISSEQMEKMLSKAHTPEANAKRIATKKRLRDEKLRRSIIERSKDPIQVEKTHSSKGRKMSEESRLKVSLARRGKKLSEEHKTKLSAAHKGRVVSEKTRQILRDAYTGNQWTKRKIALADDKRAAVGSAISMMPDIEDEPSFE